MSWIRVRQTVAPVVALTASRALTASAAQAQRRGGGPRGRATGGVVPSHGFYGPYWGFGWYASPWGFGFGYDPYFGPGYRPAGGIDPNVAMIAGIGALDLNVKPGEAEVWVDGKYRAEAKDLDGYPSSLWLKEGVHRIVVYKGGYAGFDEEIEVQAGVRKELKLRLEKGDAQPPGRRPDKKEKAREGAE
jgi:hypothetical protein